MSINFLYENVSQTDFLEHDCEFAVPKGPAQSPDLNPASLDCGGKEDAHRG